MEKQEAQEMLRDKLLDAAKCFYDTGYHRQSSSFTYVDIGSSYNGEVNVIDITISYRNGRPEERSEGWN